MPGSDSGIPIRSACVLTPLHMALSSSFSLIFRPLFPPGFKRFCFHFNSVTFITLAFMYHLHTRLLKKKKTTLFEKIVFTHSEKGSRGLRGLGSGRVLGTYHMGPKHRME